MSDFNNILKIADEDRKVLEKKDASYGSSWREEGGFSAYFNTSRKWSRFHKQCKDHGFDVFKAHDALPEGEEAMIESVRDLRRYLFLIEMHLMYEREGNQ